MCPAAGDGLRHQSRACAEALVEIMCGWRSLTRIRFDTERVSLHAPYVRHVCAGCSCLCLSSYTLHYFSGPAVAPSPHSIPAQALASSDLFRAPKRCSSISHPREWKTSIGHFSVHSTPAVHVYISTRTSPLSFLRDVPNICRWLRKFETYSGSVVLLRFALPPSTSLKNCCSLPHSFLSV